MRAAALLVLGTFFGFIGALLQTYTTTIGALRLPVGAVLALVTITLVARAGAWWQGSRLGAVVFTVGWLAATLLMGMESRAGDLILTSGNRQIGYLIVGSILLSAACGLPLLPEDDDPQPDPLHSQTGASDA